MKTIKGVVLATVVAGMSAMASAGTPSINEAAAVCKSQASLQYAAGDSAARIKFKGVYGGNDSRKVRLQVLPAGGKAFLAICRVDGRSGEIVALAPVAQATGPTLAAAGR